MLYNHYTVNSDLWKLRVNASNSSFFADHKFDLVALCKTSSSTKSSFISWNFSAKLQMTSLKSPLIEVNSFELFYSSNLAHARMSTCNTLCCSSRLKQSSASWSSMPSNSLATSPPSCAFTRHSCWPPEPCDLVNTSSSPGYSEFHKISLRICSLLVKQGLASRKRMIMQ